MPHSDLEPGAAPDISAPAPDVMARILEPRVRSNAKNNPKAVKTAPPKPAAPFGAKLETAPVIPLQSPLEASTLGDEAVQPNEVRELIAALQESHVARDRAFDLLYEELSGYKNDFYLERLKPTLRALLFLLDSIEGFDGEVEALKNLGESVSNDDVQLNLRHFRDQLTDVLTQCEMTPIEPSGDKFDPKTQRAIEVVSVEADKNNSVQRQIRGGWKLNGKLLRPADVVVGKSESK